MMKPTHADRLAIKRMRRAATLATIALTLLLAMLPAARAQNSFYGHDRTWKHGRVMGNTTVPEDYLRNERDLSGASGFGNSKSGNIGNTYAVPVNYGGNSARHSQAWLNGMGGIDPAQYDVPANYQTTQQPQQQYVQRPQQQYNQQTAPMQSPNSEGTTYTFAPRRTASRHVVKQPTAMYYSNQPAGYWGSAPRNQPLIQGGSGNSYTLPGRGRY